MLNNATSFVMILNVVPTRTMRAMHCHELMICRKIRLCHFSIFIRLYIYAASNVLFAVVVVAIFFSLFICIMCEDARQKNACAYSSMIWLGSRANSVTDTFNRNGQGER